MNSQKLLVAILSTFISQSSFAQEYAVDKGATIISGSFGFESSGGDLYGNDRASTLQFTPSFSHLVAKNFFIGGTIEFAGQWQGGASLTSFAIGPHLGYAGGSASSNVFPYFIFGFRYITSSIDFGDGFFGGSSSVSGTDFMLGLGTIVALKKHLGLTVGVNFDFVTLGDDGESESGNTISLGVGLCGLLFKSGETK